MSPVPETQATVGSLLSRKLSAVGHTEMNSLASLFQLQAWWRGTVVRKEIGNFKMPKKDKDDSKDSKGKEKEKRRGKK